jgi:hypothetical protein
MMERYEPGSIGFCHSKGIISWAIRLGERLRFRHGGFWNHVFIVSDKTNEQGDQLVIQALGNGVDGTKSISTIAPGGSYKIVPPPVDVLGSDVLLFAESQIGYPYGYLSIVSIALQIILPKWLPLPRVRTNSSWICSALGAESLRCGGWVHDWPDIYSVVPSELYAALAGLKLRDLPYRDFSKKIA